MGVVKRTFGGSKGNVSLHGGTMGVREHSVLFWFVMAGSNDEPKGEEKSEV
jgi:hypothetical protein